MLGSPDHPENHNQICKVLTVCVHEGAVDERNNQNRAVRTEQTLSTADDDDSNVSRHDSLARPVCVCVHACTCARHLPSKCEKHEQVELDIPPQLSSPQSDSELEREAVRLLRHVMRHLMDKLCPNGMERIKFATLKKKKKKKKVARALSKQRRSCCSATPARLPCCRKKWRGVHIRSIWRQNVKMK